MESPLGHPACRLWHTDPFNGRVRNIGTAISLLSCGPTQIGPITSWLERDADGRYPPGTVNALVDQRLAELSEDRAGTGNGDGNGRSRGKDGVSDEAPADPPHEPVLPGQRPGFEAFRFGCFGIRVRSHLIDDGN